MRWAVLLVILLSAVVPGRAGIIFNNFGPGDSYDSSGAGGYVLGSATGYEQGNAFVPSSTVTLDRIVLPVGLLSGPNELSVWLMTDAFWRPGAIIEAWSFSGMMGTYGELNPPLSAESVMHPILSGGTRYWLIAGTPTTDTLAGWNLNSIGHTGPRAYREDAGPWGSSFQVTTAAFRLESKDEGVIPEPSTLWLFAGGAALLSARRLRPARLIRWRAGQRRRCRRRPLPATCRASRGL